MHKGYGRIATGAMAALMAASAAMAEPILGAWRTEPDGKGQTGEVEVVPCGAAFCGTIVRAFDPGGGEIVTQNVGRQVLLGMVPAGDGLYEGRVFVPLMGTDFAATVEVAGSRMSLRACNALGVCRTQDWDRAP